MPRATKRGPGHPITTGRRGPGAKAWLVRVGPDEAKAIERRAKQDGAESVAEWLREMAMALTRTESKQPAPPPRRQ